MHLYSIFTSFSDILQKILDFLGLQKMQRLLFKHTYELTNIIYVDRFQNNLYSQVIVKLEDLQVCMVLFYVTTLIVLLTI